MSGILRKNTQRDIARRSAEMTIRPTAEGSYYRFRLLSFPPDPEFVKSAGLTYYRDLHFLPRYMHVVWTEEPSDKSPTGVRNVRHVIPCPASEYIRVNSGLTKKGCPICNAGNAALQAYTDSGKRNQVAKEKWLKCKNVFEALVPVYVVQDPNNDANNGSVKVWRVNEEQYQRLINIVNEAERGKTPIFNDNAVDLYFSFGLEEKSRTNKRTGETKTWKQNDIGRLGLTTSVYKVDGLDDLVRGLNFDANFFTIPTLDELQDFYVKNIASAAVPNDIPSDIPNDIPAAPAPKAAPVKDDFEELKGFPAGPINEAPKAKAAPVADIPPVEPPPAAPAKADIPAEKPNEANLDSDIDSFMKGISL